MKKLISVMLAAVLVLGLACPAAAASETVEDKTAGVRLELPRGWSASSVKENRITFSYKNDEDAEIRYEATDLLEGTDASASKRAKIDNDFYSIGEVAEEYGVPEKQVELCRLGGEEYYQVEIVERKLFFRTVTDTYLVRFENGWMFSFSFNGGEKDDLYEDFEELVEDAEYNVAEEAPPDTTTSATPSATTPAATSGGSTQDDYDAAVDAYESGLYRDAEEMFEALSGYKDSDKYLRLLQIRQFGGNLALGVTYDFDLGLTDRQKAVIDAAMEDFYFSDTAEVLLFNTDVASYVLFDRWETAKGATPYAYLEFRKDAAGGYGYIRSSNISGAFSNTVIILMGYVYLSADGSANPTMQLRLTSPDCLELYSYETCNSFCLYRK